MKKLVCLLIIFMVVLLTSCAKDYSGQYGGVSEAGVFMSMTLNKDGTLETDILGLPLSGTYEISGNTIEVTIIMMGYGQSVRGRISGDKIQFADVTLEKGVTHVNINDYQYGW